MKTLDIVVGRSPLKLAAVVESFRARGWTGNVLTVDKPSGVSRQPRGFAETAKGAHNRAQAGHEAHPDALAIGIENGIRLVDGAWRDWALIDAIWPDGTEVMVESESVHFPTWAVEKAQETDASVGSVLAEAYGCAADDPHSYLTGGRRSRKDILSAAVSEIWEIGNVI